jgi:hypothetical protein
MQNKKVRFMSISGGWAQDRKEMRGGKYPFAAGC